MNFSHVKESIIPEGNVSLIQNNQGEVMWKSGPPMHDHLDDYTIDELSEISDYLEGIDFATRTSDQVYQKFLGFCNNNEIWFSNSNSKQPSTATYIDSSTADTSKCNQSYKCTFDGGQTIDKFMFLIVKGILHDYDEDHNRIGLTMECAHSIPTSYYIGDMYDWWNTSSLRPKLQPGGSIYNQIPSAIRNKIKPCKKWSYDNTEIRTTIDYMFLASYSENYKTDNVFTSYAAYANGRDSSGSQTFNPANAVTEGYCYEWNWNQNISGTNSNSIYAKRGYRNSNMQPVSSTGLSAWQRSIKPAQVTQWLGINSSGDIFMVLGDAYRYGVSPCFCL